MPDFIDIVGQGAALAQLQRAAAGDRRPHAYLFVGPEGVGRRTTAVELARLLLCDRPASTANNGRIAELAEDFALRQGCGQCPSCRSLSAGTNPDLHVIYRQLARYHEDAKVRDSVMQDLGIPVIRQFLIERASLASAGGRGKVFVVREAELMSDAAQNALLKTLEEPPEGVTIVLISTSAADMLPTTRSRCQTVRFGPLPVDFVTDALTRAGVAGAEARFWAAMTEGSIGMAQRLGGEGLYEFKVKVVRLAAELSASGARAFAELLRSAMEKRAKRLRSRDEGLAASLANRQVAQVLLGLLSSLYRDALAVACGADRPLVNADQAAEVDAVAGRFGPSGLAEILAHLARYEQLVWRNVNAKLLWDNVAVTCASAAPLRV